jgi:hypothetical protein
MQLLIVFISIQLFTQHVSSDTRSSSGVFSTVHTASSYLCCCLSVALWQQDSLLLHLTLQICTESKTLNHELLSKTLSHSHFKTLNFFKKFCKNVIKNPKYFGHYHMTILRGRLLYLERYHFSACLLRHLHYSVCGCMCLCECVPGVPAYGLSGSERWSLDRQNQIPSLHEYKRFALVWLMVQLLIGAVSIAHIRGSFKMFPESPYLWEKPNSTTI